jgi:peroxiredoxin Q/BCP
MRLIILLAIAICAFFAIRSRPAAAQALNEGEIAPDFSTQMVEGDQIKPVKLSDFRGKRVVLYFYPKDFTPGCTKEACSFRDGFSRFQKAGIVVLGCSIDSSDNHRAFIKKYSLQFPLLLDPDKTIARTYGAANGIPILGFDKRITYLIDPAGKILKVYPSVDPSVHATEILEVLEKSPAASGPAASN